MKNISFAILGLFVAASAAFGVSPHPDFEYPTLRADDMKVIDAAYGFKDVRRFDLVLTKKRSALKPTGMVALITEDHASLPRHVTLEITDSTRDACGSVTYIASLKDSRPMAGRFSVVLHDHTFRKCRDFKPARWEAEVREGFGWCGTGDATMEVAGNPRHVVRAVLH